MQHVSRLPWSESREFMVVNWPGAHANEIFSILNYTNNIWMCNIWMPTYLSRNMDNICCKSGTSLRYCSFAGDVQWITIGITFIGFHFNVWSLHGFPWCPTPVESTDGIIEIVSLNVTEIPLSDDLDQECIVRSCLQWFPVTVLLLYPNWTMATRRRPGNIDGHKSYQCFHISSEG